MRAWPLNDPLRWIHGANLPWRFVFRVKRIHEAASSDDGHRVLVDRLWPRGVSKERAALDAWPKEVTPSDALRRAFHAGILDDDAFARRYRRELAASEEAHATLEDLQLRAADGAVTLLSAVKDPEGGHVAVLLDLLQE